VSSILLLSLSIPEDLPVEFYSVFSSQASA
jgi:hypothetical protein